MAFVKRSLSAFAKNTEEEECPYVQHEENKHTSAKDRFDLKIPGLTAKLKNLLTSTEAVRGEDLSHAQGPELKSKVDELREPLSENIFDAAFLGHEQQATLSMSSLQNKFFIATAQANIPEMSDLANQGANLNATCLDQGLTPLLMACGLGHDSAVSFLLQRGASVFTVDVRTGWCPLHFVAINSLHKWESAAACARHLLRAGVEVDQQTNDGRTALHFACEAGNPFVTKELLSAGAMPNSCADDGKTPLHFACIEGSLECVKRLVAAGAQESKDISGREPIELAHKVGHHDVVDFLLKVRGNSSSLPESISRALEQASPSSMRPSDLDGSDTIPPERWFALDDQGRMLETGDKKVALFTSRAAAAKWAVSVLEPPRDSFQVTEILAEKWRMFQEEVEFQWADEDDDPLWEQFRLQKKNESSTEMGTQEEQALLSKISKTKQEIEMLEAEREQVFHSHQEIELESNLVRSRCLALQESISKYRSILNERDAQSASSNEQEAIQCPGQQSVEQENQTEPGQETPVEDAVAVCLNTTSNNQKAWDLGEDTESSLSLVHENKEDVHLAQASNLACKNHNETLPPSLPGGKSQDVLTDEQVSEITSAVDMMILESRCLIEQGNSQAIDESLGNDIHSQQEITVLVDSSSVGSDELHSPSRSRCSSNNLLETPLPFTAFFSDENCADHKAKVIEELVMWLQSLHISLDDANVYAAGFVKDGFDSLDSLINITEEELLWYSTKKEHSRIILKHLALSKQLIG